MLGGAIESPAFADIESRKPLTVDYQMQRAAMVPGPPPITPMVHGLPDMIPRNDAAGFQYLHFFGKHSEEELFSNVMSLATGKASTDHPRVQALMHHSFGHMPEILETYNRS